MASSVVKNSHQNDTLVKESYANEKIVVALESFTMAQIISYFIDDFSSRILFSLKSDPTNHVNKAMT